MGEALAIDRVSAAADRGRLRERQPGDEPGRIRSTRLAARCVSDGAAAPLRIDLFDDEIEAIRRFDPDTQRSLDCARGVRLLPAREMPLDAEAVREFRRRFRTRFEGDPTRAASTAASARASLRPASSSTCRCSSRPPRRCSTICRANAVFVHDAALPGALENAWQDIAGALRGSPPRHRAAAAAAAGAVHRSRGDRRAAAALSRPSTLDTLQGRSRSCDARRRRAQLPDRRAARAAHRCARRQSARASDEFLRAVRRPRAHRRRFAGRREVLREMLRAPRPSVATLPGWEQFASGNAPLALTVAPDIEGLTLTAPPIALRLRSAAVRRARAAGAPPQARGRRSGGDPARPAGSQPRRPGRARGIRRRPLCRTAGDGCRRPAGRVSGARVSRRRSRLRAGAVAAPGQPLHRRRAGERAAAQARHGPVGAGAASAPPSRFATWPRSCSTCMRAASAQRGLDARGSTSWSIRPSPMPSRSRRRTTRPRRSAQVLADLQSERPMDRIVCGDVGFGKTEVAMRAAFVAVQAGKQVAVLAPTTLLAQQHLTNFRDRFADWPVRIESLSRFGNPERDAGDARRPSSSGTVDIVIATHRLLHAHARFKDLGLMIIDEEHRFGVRDKERLQALRAEVHVLTLTATPDPAHAQHGARADCAICRSSRRRRPSGSRSRPSSSNGTRRRCARRRCASCGAADRSTSCTTRCSTHREDRRRGAGARSRSAACASATGRCASAIWSS